ncbi:MAG: Abi family protein [Pseudomonadota bacterium]|nr:Abi family protein [Alphaproteobacteria bacterium]MEC7701503.1 Abi family protein [Pseudomonadota bacterium]MEC9235324.1 Abi family protein [Pseudomonadota bacterium]|tara:strand:- start:255 stop:1160 length:906 start_codon:yes stop_codon:yes gene_type:complete
MSEDYNKRPLTFEDQVRQLKDRGLLIEDSSQATSFLSSVNYYRLSAYWYPFRIKNTDGQISSKFREDAKFDEITELYEFDRHLRLLMIDAIERIEVAVRTQVSYVMAHKYGAFAHSDKSNFHPKFNHTDWIQKVEHETERSREDFIQHYRTKYNGFPTLPIWMLTEVMSLGALSRLYSGMKNEDKRSVAGEFSLHYKQMKDWLHVLTYIRNICTHHGRLWNRELAIKTVVPKSGSWLPPITPTNKRVFFTLLIIRTMLKSIHAGDHWSSEVTRTLKPIAKNMLWRQAMGLPDNWESHPIWK